MCYVAHISSAKNARQHAPFAIIVCRILAASGVDLTNETSLFQMPPHMLIAYAIADMYFIYRLGNWYRNPPSRDIHLHVKNPQVPPSTAEEWARQSRVQEEAALDSADDPHDDILTGTRASSGTRRVYFAIFDCLDNLISRLSLLENHAMTQSYSTDIHAPQFDSSAWDELDEPDSSSDEVKFDLYFVAFVFDF